MIRKAGPDQVAYYEKKLYPLQDEVLGFLIDKLRTSPKRILFIKMILPHIKTSSGWEEAIHKALDDHKAVTTPMNPVIPV